MNFKSKIFYKLYEGYEEARFSRVFNNHQRPINERYQEAVFIPEDENDVVEAVKYANENNLKIAVRAGGHSWAAWSGNSHLKNRIIELPLPLAIGQKRQRKHY